MAPARNLVPAAPEAVLVTGASTGIGAAAADALARAGYAVFAGVRKESGSVRSSERHTGVRETKLDVTDASSIARAAATVAESGLALRGVVNNAGIALGGPLEFLPVDELRRQFEVNVFGAVAVTQAFLPQLRSARGRLLFVGSVSGRAAVPFLGPYSASKFALRAIADALRVELAPSGIVVVLIEPASVKTPIWRKGRESRHELLRSLGPQAQRYYKEELEALFRMTEREERNAMPVELVTNAILHAMNARRPRAHYAVGAALAKFFGVLPARLQDRLMRESLQRR